MTKAECCVYCVGTSPASVDVLSVNVTRKFNTRTLKTKVAVYIK